MTIDLGICRKCGALKPPGSICKKCTPFLSKADKRSVQVNNNGSSDQLTSNKQKKHLPVQKRKKIMSTSHLGSQFHKRPKTIARYSAERGLEIDWDLHTPESERARAVYCIRCGKLKAKWEGIWIIPGGHGDLDPEVRAKRVFLCGQCWSPGRRGMKVGDYLNTFNNEDDDNDSVYNPL